jgi:hypothetical protein
MTELETSENRRAPQVPKQNSISSDNRFDAAPASPSFDTPVDRGPEVVATTLAPQLGSNAQHLGRGDFDMRKLSVIEQKDIPLLIYSKIRGKKSSSWAGIYEEFLNLQVSVGGRGRRDIIRMEGVSKGGLPEMESISENKPGWLERNVLDRTWKKKQQTDQM